MNRHMRRAAAKKMPSLGGATTAVEKAVEQLKGLQGLGEAPKLMEEVRELVQNLTTRIDELELSLAVRQDVLPQLLARLTHHSVEQVLAIEAELTLAEFRRRGIIGGG